MLEESEIDRERGYALTRPLRPVLDAAEAAQADLEALKQALDEGLRRGLITRTELKSARGQEGLSEEMR